MGLPKLSRASSSPHRARSLTFKLEPFGEFYKEAEELLRLHWEEVAPHKDLLWLNPNLFFYHQAAEKNILHVVTARDGRKLVGYVWMMLHPHTHYQHCKVALQDIYFLHPDYRKGMNAVRMFKATEGFMKDMGAKIMVFGHKVNSPYGALFRRMGYSPLDITYSKRLT